MSALPVRSHGLRAHRLRAHRLRAHRLRAHRLAAAALGLLAAALPGAAARAQSASFVAGLDRDAAAPDEPFTYDVTLTVANDNVED